MDTLQQLKNNSLEVGITINEKKTKYLKCTTKDINIENLNIRSSYIEQVKQYNYLGSIINDTNSIEEKVKERIALLIHCNIHHYRKLYSSLITSGKTPSSYKIKIKL